MRITILVTQYERAGSQKAALALTQFLHGAGHDVALLFLYDKEVRPPQFQTGNEIYIASLAAKTAAKGRIFGALWRLFRHFRQQQTEVVFTLTPYSNWLGTGVAWLAGVPVRIASQRNSLPHLARPMLWLDRLITNSRLVTKMTTVSAETLAFCIEQEQIKPEKLLLIPNGIHDNIAAPLARETLNLSDADCVVLTVARLHPQKGHQYLLQAAQKLVQRYPQLCFLWVGNGALETELQAAIKHYELQDHIYLLGARDDVPALLAMADLFVLPSLFEGMSNALLEAMVAAKPIIATAVDGTQALLKNRVSGMVVPAADAEALRVAIDTFMQMPEADRLRLGAAARQMALADFSAETTHHHYLSLFQSLLAEATS